MAKAPDPKLLAILEEYGETPRDAMWDCHGTWVVYHRAIERIAAKAKISFDMPEIVEAKSADRIVAIVARGFMGDRSEWSFGEAAPGNNKNSYPYAMAEKRAKDRVVLKLVGLHGLAFSEEESDDFSAPKVIDPPTEQKSSAALKRDDAWNKLMFQLSVDFGDCKSLVTLSKLRAQYRERAKTEGWTRAWLEALKNEFDTFEEGLPKTDDEFPGDKPSRNKYMEAVGGM